MLATKKQLEDLSKYVHDLERHYEKRIYQLENPPEFKIGDRILWFKYEKDKTATVTDVSLADTSYSFNYEYTVVDCSTGSTYKKSQYEISKVTESND